MQETARLCIIDVCRVPARLIEGRQGFFILRFLLPRHPRRGIGSIAVARSYVVI